MLLQEALLSDGRRYTTKPAGETYPAAFIFHVDDLFELGLLPLAADHVDVDAVTPEQLQWGEVPRWDDLVYTS